MGARQVFRHRQKGIEAQVEAQIQEEVEAGGCQARRKALFYQAKHPTQVAAPYPTLKEKPMPSDMTVAHYKRFMESGVCACGKHLDQHVSTEAEIPFQADPPCKLTRSLVPLWNTISVQGNRPSL